MRNIYDFLFELPTTLSVRACVCVRVLQFVQSYSNDLSNFHANSSKAEIQQNLSFMFEFMHLAYVKYAMNFQEFKV